MRLRRSRTALLFLLCATGAAAQPPGYKPLEAHPEVTSISDEITRDLDLVTEVATTTKENEPYQPYIITTLEGKELEKLGIRNLQEALELIPGVDIGTNLLDVKTPIFRGSNPFAYGQVKLLIDDMVANDLLYDGFAGYLYLPIEIIKRIEVIRGPGSKTDGVNAYAGTIHVVTYAEEFAVTGSVNRVFAKGGSCDFGGGGFVTSFSEDALHVHLDGYYLRDNKKLTAGPDTAATGAYGGINIPLAQTGDAPLQTETYALGLQLDYDAFYLKARGTFWKHGSAYGINGMLPRDDDRVFFPSYLSEIGWQPSSGALKADIRLGTKYDAFESDALLLPAGFTDPETNTTYSNGFQGIHKASNRSFYQSSYLIYSGFDAHKITLGYRLTREETYDVVTKTTDRDTGTGMVDYSETLPFFDSDAERDTVMVSVQDQMEIGPRISMLYGINIEKTSLSDTQYDPRVSFVFQKNRQHIFKALYSHSHRNPSWQELFVMNTKSGLGNPDLKPETVDTFELAAIHKFSGDDYLQADLFYLFNKDQIDKNQIDDATKAHIFRNAHDTELYGVELELRTHITPRDRFYAGYSYVNGHSVESNAMANVARHLAKASYLYEFSPALSTAAVVKYVGAKGRVEADPRDDTKPYLTADLSLRYSDPAARFSLAASVKNLADASVVYPSEPYTYANDYPQEGRTFFLTVTKEF
ncbi:MAG: TonB-dependent receptor [Campylobacterales bacterium]|jgi:iron complex outermembrane receptor protein